MGKVYSTSAPRIKTRGEQAFDGAVFVLVCLFLSWVLITFIEYLFSPFTKLMTWKMAREKIREDFDNKVRRREARHEKLSEQESDPMNQFQSRFLREPEEWRGDPDNASFYAWYKAWHEGEVKDSSLRWAPAVMVDGVVSKDFLCYLSAQRALHKGAFSRMALLATISACYPEFTPTWKGLEEDIESYMLECGNQELKTELRKEIGKLGINEEAAEWLEGRDAQTIRKDALFLKKCTEHGVSDEAAKCLLHTGVEPGTPEGDCVCGIIEKLRLPAYAAEGFIKGEYLAEELGEIAEYLQEARKDYGSFFYWINEGSDKTVGEQLAEEKFKQLRARKRAARLEDVCTRKA